MHLPIPAEMWTCHGCGGSRQFFGPIDRRALRCPNCEGGHFSNFLTKEDHEFLRDAGVRPEAYHCLRTSGTPRAWFTSIKDAEDFLRDPPFGYDANEIPLWCLGCGFVHVVKPEWIRDAT